MSEETQNQQQKFAIRFGLGAIKAVGLNMMENVVKERQENGEFSDIYDFAERVDPKSVNKKSIEALAKSGSFDSIHQNRCQLAESFEILSAFSATKSEEASSNQMTLFGGLPEANLNPELKKVSDWSKVDRLQKEFEAFGFFLNEHPLDDLLSDLKKRGVIFSDRIENEGLEDGSLIKMPGVIASSKHRSSARGRFAYLTISDPFGIFEAMIFDEALITAARDILTDGSKVLLECLIRKDEGGTRILVRDVKKLEDFIRNTKPREQDFEDIQKQIMRKRRFDNNKKPVPEQSAKHVVEGPAPAAVIVEEKKPFQKVEITIRDASPILTLKSLLSRLQLDANDQENSAKACKVIFSLLSADKAPVKIELPEKYLIQDSDIFRLRHIEKVVSVKGF